MAPITWRNIDAPNLNGGAYGLQLAGQSFDRAADGVNRLFEEQQRIDSANWDNQARINTQDAVARLKGMVNLQDLNAQEGSFDPTALRSTMGQQFDATTIIRALAEQKAKLTGEAVTAAGTTGLNTADNTHSVSQAVDAYRNSLIQSGIKDPNVINSKVQEFMQSGLAGKKEGWTEQEDQQIAQGRAMLQGDGLNNPIGSTNGEANTVSIPLDHAKLPLVHPEYTSGSDTFDPIAYAKAEAKRYGVPESLVLKVMKTESGMKDYGKRSDGTPKGRGFLGELKRPDGGISTELSIGTNINGKEMLIPSIVPTLTKDELASVLTLKNGELPSESVIQKSISHAKSRLNAGKNVFADSTDIVSPKGAEGYMQVIPGTFKDMGGTDHTDPRQNISAGIKYLAKNLRERNGNVPLALAAYNAGPGAVNAAGNQIPNFKETQDYVQKITGGAGNISSLSTGGGATNLNSVVSGLGSIGKVTPRVINELQKQEELLRHNRTNDIATASQQNSLDETLRKQVTDRVSSAHANAAFGQFTDVANPNAGDLEAALKTIPNDEYGAAARVKLKEMVKPVMEKSQATLDNEKYQDSNVLAAIKAVSDKHDAVITGINNNMGFVAPSAELQQHAVDAEAHPNGIGGYVRDTLKGNGWNFFGRQGEAGNAVIQSLTKMKGDMVKQGVTPLLATRIILDAMKEAGAMQSSFFNRDNQLLMTNEIEAKMPQAISNAVKYGQLQGELANAQTMKVSNDNKYAQLLRDYQGSVAASRNRAQALGQRASLDEGTQKKIDALLAESRKAPEELVMPKSMLSTELDKLQAMLPDTVAKSKQLQEEASKQAAQAKPSRSYPFLPWN